MKDKSLNATAAALLGLLHDGPMTGGQLMVAAQTRLGPFWTTTRSQVYRELPLLAEKGYLRAGKLGPRSSQPYAILAAGKKAFQNWMEQPAGKDQIRNPLLLRTAFGALLPKGALKELYAEQTEERNAYLNELRNSLRIAKSEGDPYAIATIEAAVAYNKAIVKWLSTAP